MIDLFGSFSLFCIQVNGAVSQYSGYTAGGRGLQRVARWSKSMSRMEEKREEHHSLHISATATAMQKIS
jgi:hypothetical protein